MHTPTKMLIQRAGFHAGMGEPEEPPGVPYQQGAPHCRDCELNKHCNHELTPFHQAR
jgi:hypothetical protein